METPATIGSASPFEIDQTRLYEFYLGWYLEGAAFFLALAAALAKLALNSRFHRGTFLAAGAVWSALAPAPPAGGFVCERKRPMAFARLAAVTGTAPFTTAPLRVASSVVAVVWLGIAAGWTALWLHLL